MDKRNLSRVKRLTRERQNSGHNRFIKAAPFQNRGGFCDLMPIKLVPDQRETMMLHMNADLVRASGFKATFNQSQRVIDITKHRKIGRGFLTVSVDNRHLETVARMTPDQCFYPALGRKRNPVNKRMVNTRQAAILKLLG